MAEKIEDSSLEDLRTRLGHYSLSNRGMTQIYIGCPIQKLEEILTQVKSATGIDRELRVEFNSDDIYGEITRQIQSKISPTDRGVLIVVFGFEKTKIAGHTINQRVHYDFLLWEKNLIVYYLNKDSEKYKEAIATAKDSQFKAGIVEVP